MQIKFKHISISNFCSIKQLDAPLYDRTVIKGANGVGKSSIRNAILFCLHNKLADGSAPDGIRPHDENGVDIDFIEISVELTLDVDGREIVLCKRQKQKWTKPRGKQEKRFDGNINEFEINGIPKKEKDYTQWIESNIAPMEALMFCTNAAAFLGLDNKKRRAKLLSLEKDFSDADVLAADKKYAPLADMLRDGAIDELISRSRKEIAKNNKKLEDIPIRIDEINKRREDADITELNRAKKDLENQISENEAKQEDVSKQFAEFDKLSDGIAELKFKLSDLERKANEENNYKRSELENNILQKKFLASKTEQTIKETEQDISLSERRIEHQTKYLEEMREKYKRSQALEFDENSLVCPYCGNEYKEDKKEEIRADFKAKKQEDLSIITAEGERAKDSVIKEKQNFFSLKNELSEHKKSLEMINTAISELEQQLSALPQSIDISNREDVKEIKKQIVEKEAAIQQGNSADEIRRFLKSEHEDFRAQLTEIEKQIAKAENNVQIDTRIEGLHAEQREIAQKIADEEKTLDLLEDFNRAKVSLLTDRVNQHFELVKWQMFKPQINGGFAEVCIPQVSGTSYNGLLNNGNKILAEIDICKAFQRTSDIVCPIMADNAESVDGWRIPKARGQMLLFARTDDRGLKIEEV